MADNNNKKDIQVLNFTNREFIEMLANDKEGLVPSQLKEQAKESLTKESPVQAFARKLGIYAD